MSSKPTNPPSSTSTARQVLELLYRYRRIDAAPSGRPPEGAAQEPCTACFEARQQKIERFVRRDEPIHLVLPAFPAKSPNRNKVLGTLPDLGEYLALSFLQSLCDHVSHFHGPGARITICSDGHVFGDVVGVDDDTVTAYRVALAEMIRAANWTSLDLFGLDDAFGGEDYPKLRQLLEQNYSSTLEELRESVRTDQAALSLFNGIHRFMFEDAVARQGADASRTRLRNDSKEAAYQTILRSNAWSRVVAERFPEAVRLSIHPQPPHSEKFGLRLLPTRDGWLTPWHGVVLDDGVAPLLVRRWEAEELDASVVSRNGRPSHFVRPQLTTHSEERQA
ncbi:isocyanide synthase family protein [Allostreptomyces psammosilenae]|uniref:Pyoverdine/dityrosine biosynthesis protein Dit1 n=1 Tax=Allostreptomyces psammosilenae TaxID=1892865 RepID=A0A852ZX82_9ACTN|nr:isocyanide synthase family protein [Allostreptomyces psammosilenae]NYI06966.1 pyoverdine/dityrosine biosynthesis protein Dit1 [Allostreptomyces psammosilenae]